ncbi:MAG: virulence RhuM family protein [Bacteroidetes bacterium]|nr:virulence RhuM family protein [Bacteroidota bacterium]MCO5278724.1 virulence RhuM family protein [Saprospiraceae bacterium]
MKNEIILYQAEDLPERIEVKIEDETVWLSQKQMASLFDKNIMTINEHISNIYKEQEVEESSTIRKSLIVKKEGNRNVKREIFLNNLDVIISVGYRVKSKRGTQFRIWATNVLREYLIKGYAINNRMNRLEDKMDNIDKKVSEIDFQIKSTKLPAQGIFFDGQIFDAYEFVSKLIRSAKKNIILIDNYINEDTLTHLCKKDKKVSAILFSKNSSKQLELDIKKANEQYGGFLLKLFSKSHDRFLIIDEKDVYHIGASLKDLGKKWFAFSKMDKHSVESILQSISNFKQE